MPRTRTIAEQNWYVGLYEASVDSFTNANTEHLRITLTKPTNGSGWPTDVSTLGTLRVQWDDGTYAEAPVPSQPMGEGAPVNAVNLTVSVPRVSGSKKAVLGGIGRLSVTRQFRASLSIAAV